MISLIRYPGSKAKMVRQILERFPAELKFPLWSESDVWDYREPFFGAGSMGIEVMQRIASSCRIWVNDIDPGMVALWQTVKDEPKVLIRRCGEFVPTTNDFYKFKGEDGDFHPASEMGFRKLALHRISYSGLGAMAGGPIGGREQSSNYNVDCRWNPQQIKQNVDRIHKVMRRFPVMRITCGDFAPMIDSASNKTFIYLDPPYYEKGEQLYKFNMDDAAHIRLRNCLMATSATWMLSYDDHPRIRDLYAGCQIEPIFTTYTSAVQRGGERPKNQEILIFPRRSPTTPEGNQ